MTPEEIPESLDDWPADDHELLGVDRRASEMEIKRAYAARIKRFKPERFPQHFRRLREAFERVRNQNRWYSANDDEDASEDQESTQQTGESTEPPNEASGEIVEAARDDRWDRACAGEHVEIYAIYREEIDRRPTDAETYVRLFWLLMAFPSLDDGLDPVVWLCRGLSAGAEPYRLASLVSDDLLHRPAAAFHEAVSGVVASTAPWKVRSRLAVRRWHSLVVSDANPGPFVRDDLRALESGRDGEDDASVRLAAAEALFLEGRNHADLINSLLGALMHRGDAFSMNEDRLDRAVLLGEQVVKRSPKTLPRHALRAALLVNGNTYEAALFVLWDYVERLASEPQMILDDLAALLRDYPTVFYLIERGINWLAPRNGLEVEREIDPEFWKILDSPELERNVSQPEWAFLFCIRFWVSPKQLGDAATKSKSLLSTKATAAIVAHSDDPVLTLAWRIYALAWTDYEPDPDPTTSQPTDEPTA